MIIASTEIISEFKQKLMDELEVLRAHQKRVRCQYEAMKAACLQAISEKGTACMQIDWSENADLFQTRQDHCAYYSSISLSLHTGYLWSNSECYGMAALSDNTNHRAAATFASWGHTFERLAKQDIKKLYIVSDSPVSQYRNKYIVHLVSETAVKYNMTIEWIYLEAGHGKGVADGIGATIKKLITDQIAFNRDVICQNAEQVLHLIKGHTNVKLSCYKSEDILKYESILPKSSYKVPGIASFHQICYTPAGNVFAASPSGENQRLIYSNFAGILLIKNEVFIIFLSLLQAQVIII